MSDIRGKRVRVKTTRHRRAHHRVRSRIHGTGERPRLAVYKSLRYIYAQLIDDRTGTTLVQANSRESAVRTQLKGGAANRSAARTVGETIARRAREKGLEDVVFDRGGYIYHGKVKELADGARAEGLKF